MAAEDSPEIRWRRKLEFIYERRVLTPMGKLVDMLF